MLGSVSGRSWAELEQWERELLPAETVAQLTDCAACIEAAELAALGWDDYYCRRHRSA